MIEIVIMPAATAAAHVQLQLHLHFHGNSAEEQNGNHVALPAHGSAPVLWPAPKTAGGLWAVDL